MPQFMRPTSDIVRSTLPFERPEKDNLGAMELISHAPAGQAPTLSTGASAFGVIDETSRDTDDYFSSGADVTTVVAVETGNPTNTPDTDANHFLRFAVGKDSSDGEAISVTVEVRQGYSDETRANIGTFIASITVATPNTPTTYVRRLTSVEAALITSYTDLQLRFIMHKGGSGAPRLTRIYWCEFEVPNLGEARNHGLSIEELRLQQAGQPIDGKVEAF